VGHREWSEDCTVVNSPAPDNGDRMAARSTSGIWKWLTIGLLMLLVLCGGVAYRIWTVVSDVSEALGPTPRHSTLTAQAANGRAEFYLTFDKAADGASDFCVMDDADNVLWRLSGRGIGKAPVIVYGQVPTESDVEWLQVTPEGGKPPPDIRGKRVRAFLTCDYRDHLGKGAQTEEVAINVPE
jgi:hypothetical protein